MANGAVNRRDYKYRDDPWQVVGFKHHCLCSAYSNSWNSKIGVCTQDYIGSCCNYKSVDTCVG